MEGEAALTIDYRPARPEDLTGIARVFARAFPDSIGHYFAHEPPLTVVAEPFALCLASEPEAFLVADAGPGEIAGYIFAPARTSRIRRTAIAGGFIWRWLLGWVTGRYGIGLAPVRALAANKVEFLTSSRQPGVEADARILSVAVDPGYQGRGVATELCARALDRLDRLGALPVRLEVRPENRPALAVYTRLGFHLVGRTRDSQGDWLIMLREGPPPQ